MKGDVTFIHGDVTEIQQFCSGARERKHSDM